MNGDRPILVLFLGPIPELVMINPRNLQECPTWFGLLLEFPVAFGDLDGEIVSVTVESHKKEYDG